MYKKQLVISSPISKPTEPPISLAVFSGCFSKLDLPFKVIDLNIELIHYLLNKKAIVSDTFTKRAFKNSKRNLELLQSKRGYANLDRYKKAVLELNKKLSYFVDEKLFKLSLADFEDFTHHSTDSSSLEKMFEFPELSPFYEFFSCFISNETNKFDPEIIGISINYLSQSLTGFAIAGYIRKKFPEIKLIIGGGLCSSWMQFDSFIKLCTKLNLDVVKGAGENNLALLAGCPQKQLLKFYPTDFSNLSFENYISQGAILPFMAERGCYYKKCRFCPERAEGNKFETNSLKTIMENLNFQIEEENPELIHFIDNAISPRVMKGLIANPLTKPWYGFARITKELEDLSFCKRLRKSGCVMLQLGIESGSDKVLKAMEKGITVYSVSKVLKNLKKAGIGVFAYFLFGTIWENEFEAMKTVEFLKNHIDCIDFLNIAIFNLPSHSPDSIGLETFKFYEGDLSLYENFVHPLGWNRNKVRNFVEKKLRKSEIINNVIKKTPPIFTSNHAAFFLMQ